MVLFPHPFFFFLNLTPAVLLLDRSSEKAKGTRFAPPTVNYSLAMASSQYQPSDSGSAAVPSKKGKRKAQEEEKEDSSEGAVAKRNRVSVLELNLPPSTRLTTLPLRPGPLLLLRGSFKRSGYLRIVLTHPLYLLSVIEGFYSQIFSKRFGSLRFSELVLRLF